MSTQAERTCSAVLRAFANFGAITLMLLALMVTIDVCVRKVTGRPLVGVFELSEVLLVVVTFSAVGLVHLDNRQLSVDILSSRVRGKRAAALRLFDAFIGLLVFGLLLWKSSEEFLKAYAGKFVRRGMIEIPTAIPVGFIALGALCIVVALIFVLWRSMRQLAGHDEGTETPTGTGF